MAEEWRTVAGAPAYEVSDHGRVRRAGGSRPLKPTVYRKNIRVWMKVDREWKLAYVHRLVCEAFNGPQPTPNHEVAHNDGNPHNNYVANLRWATRAENLSDRVAHGTMTWGEKNPSAILTERDVLEIRRLHAGGRMMKDLAADFGVTAAAISYICNRKTWRHV